MNKDDYIKIAKSKLNDKASKIMIEQIENYYDLKECKLNNNNYKIGDYVYLKKGTLLHGTYKNIEGLKSIVENGLISSWFTDSRISKYPSSISVWNLKKDYKLKDYINFYSGGTILYSGVKNSKKENISKVIPYDKINDLINIVTKVNCHIWSMEQTKEARFMPSLVQNNVQIGIIFNGNNKVVRKLLKGDILNPKNINDKNVKEFVNPNYYDKFIKERLNKNDFFTDRESAILFGIPSNTIEGILVGRKYEKNNSVLKEIKKLLPNCYICNLDGIVIK